MYLITAHKERMWLKVVNWAQKKRIKVEEISTSEVMEALKYELKSGSSLRSM